MHVDGLHRLRLCITFYYLKGLLNLHRFLYYLATTDRNESFTSDICEATFTRNGLYDKCNVSTELLLFSLQYNNYKHLLLICAFSFVLS